MCWFDMMIESKARRWWRIISIVINVGNVTIVVYSELCGLQVTKRVGEVPGISERLKVNEMNKFSITSCEARCGNGLMFAAKDFIVLI